MTLAHGVIEAILLDSMFIIFNFFYKQKSENQTKDQVDLQTLDDIINVTVPLPHFSVNFELGSKRSCIHYM